MKNPFTFRIESMLGALLILAISGFFVGLFYTYMKDYDSELTSLDSSSNVKWLAAAHLSAQERQDILGWVSKNKITLPKNSDQVRYLIVKYPDRPWLDQ